MKVLSVIVDKLPESCDSCILSRYIASYPICVPLGNLPIDSMVKRRPDCPLIAVGAKSREEIVHRLEGDDGR